MRLIGVLLFLSLLAINGVAAAEEKVTVSVKGVSTIATTDDSFVCACIDWWPEDKCNYGWCPWGKSSALNLDLENPLLNTALEAFRLNPKNSSERNMPPLRVRIGGSLQDQLIYKIGKNRPKCPKFKLVDHGPFNYTDGCLNMCKWDKLNEFFNKNDVVLTFGLNAMLGRKEAPPSKQEANKNILYEGSWDSSNAKNFINYTASKGFNVDTWEFGNEVSGNGVYWRVDAETYGQDLIVLRHIIDELYQDKAMKPKLVAPGGFYDQRWFAKMFRVSGPEVVDTVTHHIYNLGPGNGPDLFKRLQDPYYLSEIVRDFRGLELTIRDNGPWSSAWVGESGGAYNNGGPESHTFVNSFWYLDQLGIASTFNNKAYCRQALVGGNYELLDKVTFVPNPDYYSALLWHRLMGRGVLHVTHNGSPYLRVYAHCGRPNPAVTLLLINLSNSTSFDISVQNDMNLYPPQRWVTAAEGAREDYYLTPKDGDLRSQVMLLNGKALEVSKDGQIPELRPVEAKNSAPIHIVPSSIAFIKFSEFGASACPP